MVPTDQYLMGPAVALAAVGVLSLVLRWIYSDGDRGKAATGKPSPARRVADFGLLVPVTTTADQFAATSLQSLLFQHGIRATLAPAPSGGVLVLIFPTDLARARALLAPSG